MTTFNIFLFLLYSTYFVGYRRKIDLFALAFLSSSLYFSVIFIGVIPAPTNYHEAQVPLEIDITYHNICLFLIVFSFVFDQKKTNTFQSLKEKINYTNANHKYYIAVLLIIAFLFLDKSLIITSTKRELIQSADIKLIVFLVTSYYASILMFCRDSITLKIASTALILFTVYLGFRSYFAFFLITILLVYIQPARRKEIHLGRIILLGISAPIILATVIVSKHAYTLLKGRSINYAMENFDLSHALNSGSEFLGTQYIYYTIIKNNAEMDLLNFFYSFFSLQPIPTSLFGIDTRAFNNFFQETFFSDVKYGMGHNPWAEMYAYFGIFSLVASPFFYSAGIYLIQTIIVRIKRDSIFFLPMIPIGILWAFYFQRNSLAVEFGFFRNFIYIHIFLFYAYKTSKYFLRKTYS